MANETILVVEDTDLNRKLVMAFLRPHGYHLLTALDGEEAIEIATRQQPDLILMDLQLPKVSGYDATQTLKSRPETADIPIVALTAHVMEDEREKLNEERRRIEEENRRMEQEYSQSVVNE